jgi:ribosomal-protein-alanine N-acetyltransferase
MNGKASKSGAASGASRSGTASGASRSGTASGASRSGTASGASKSGTASGASKSGTASGASKSGTATLRPMRWWDVDGVMDLERDLFGDECWTIAMFWSELAEPDTRYYLVAEEGAEIVGYAGLCAYPEESFVQTIAVKRDRQGCGIGGRMLTVLIDEARRRDEPMVGLEVRADNLVAQRIYHRFGFEQVGVRKGYYQPSGTDAVLMVLNLKGVDPLLWAGHQDTVDDAGQPASHG